MKKSWIRFWLAAALVFAAAAPAVAQDSGPPIRFVVSGAAGGSIDILARMIAQESAKILGTTIVVENKPGNSGIVGAAEVAKAAPDGRTFLFTTVGPMVNNAAVFAKLPYDAAKDFVPVSAVGRFPLTFFVRADSPYKSVMDVVAAAKARPGALNFGTAGPANLTNLAAERLAELQGFKFTAVPYNSEPAMMVALGGGQVDVVITTLSGGIALVQGGHLRALAMLDAERFPMLPDVPTMKEQGVAGLEAAGTPCIYAPTGTPREAIDRLNRSVTQVLRLPEVARKMRELLMVPQGGPPEELTAIMKLEGERWVPIIKRLGIRQ